MSEYIHVVYEDDGQVRILQSEEEEIVELLRHSLPAIRSGEIKRHDIFDYDDDRMRQTVTSYTPENIDEVEASLRTRLQGLRS